MQAGTEWQIQISRHIIHFDGDQVEINIYLKELQ